MSGYRNFILIGEPGAIIIRPSCWRLRNGVGRSIVLLVEHFILIILIPGERACIEELELTQALFDVISYVDQRLQKDT